MSTPGRVDTAKKLMEAMKSVVSMEREARGIDKIPAEKPTDGLAAFLAGRKGSTLPIACDVEPDEFIR